MINSGIRPSQYDLAYQGIDAAEVVHWNLSSAELVEKALQRREGMLARGGPFVVRTGQFTGRSPKDKYIVRDAATENTVDWGPVNQPLTQEQFDDMYRRLVNSWQGEELFVQDCFAGADPEFSLPVRVIAARAWHALFARQLFVRPDPGSTGQHKPEFSVLFAPAFFTDPQRDGTRSKTCIAVSFERRAVIIAGTEYAGEMKKSIFSVLNYLLPARGVLPMHCSANVGAGGDTALFFGLSGTGKTTLSADPRRRLIGDDEHGWSAHGVFNFEGGCYAKCIHLSREKEPQIWNAIRFGTVLENVAMDPGTRELDYDSAEWTENTRAAYPVDFIEGAVIPGMGGHPSHILLLTADAFGVLPPVARLTRPQALYHFLSGYTAKLAGTERGLSKEPTATFSACFAAPFLPRSPLVYARILGERIRDHKAACYLVNTGWTGGPYGTGSRIALHYTRAIVDAILEARLDRAETVTDAVFGLRVPQHCPGVPDAILDARAQWVSGVDYDRAARDLQARFDENFRAFGHAAEEVVELEAVS